MKLFICIVLDLTAQIIISDFNWRNQNTNRKSLQNIKRRVETNLLALSLSRYNNIIELLLCPRRAGILFPSAEKESKTR